MKSKKNRLKFLFLNLIIIILAMPHLDAKEVKTLFEQKFKRDNISLANQSAEVIFLDTKYAEYIFQDKPDEIIISEFPISTDAEAKVTLNLSQNVISNDTKFMTVDEGGMHPYPRPKILTYFGYLNDDKESKVYLTYSANQIYALIQLSSGEIYSISPEYSTNDALQKHFITRGDKFFGVAPPWICLTDDATGNHTFTEDLKHLNDVPLSPAKLIDVKVACEGTYEFFRLFYSLNQATTYISSVMAFASKIYEENINVRLTISYFLIWQKQDLDPYKDAPFLPDKLSLMPEYWENREVDRSIAVLFASIEAQPSGTSVAGIAYGGTPGKGNLCNTQWGYCVLGIKGGVQFPTTNYAWDVNVAAHEIGHLFGAPHTHRCYWDPPIDTCVTKDMGISDACNSTGIVPRPGTIMSYCHLTNSSHSVQLYFHDLQKPLMRKAAESATCNKEVNQPYISLLNPLGGELYKAGGIIPIRWTASQVNSISIKYSLNDGESWINIADFIDVNDSIYHWTAPDITNKNVLILIHKSTDMAVHDISWVKLAIVQPMISVIDPVEASEFPQNTEIKINWQSVFIDSLTISFTSNGGSTWSDIAHLGKVFEFTWKLPEIQSENCRFRLTSADGNNIIAYSGNFSVGKPTADILTPSQDAVLCIGERYEITWQTKYVNVFYLNYSIDNGETWNKVTPIPFKYSTTSYSWGIPNKPSDKVKLQIVTRIDNQYILLANTNGTMTIKECINDIGTNGDGNDAISIYPQPAKNFIIININKKLIPEIQFAGIYNSKGKLVKNIIGMNNKTTFQIDLSDFSSGSYYINIKTPQSNIIKKFNVLR